MVVLETKRLILRALTFYDAFDMFEYAQDSRVGPMAGWLPHQNISETNEILKRIMDSNEVWAIIYKENGKMIGTIGLHIKKESNISSRSLGYILNPNYWGKGLMVEAASKIIEFGFRGLGLEVIRVAHYQENQQSKRVIEKLGFTYEGITRKYYRYPSGQITDCLNYSITSEEFLKNHRF